MGDIAGAVDTMHTPAAQSRADQTARRERDAAALTYLTAHDALDIAQILGLLPAEPARRRSARQVGRNCAVCGTRFAPDNTGQQTCSRSCGGQHGHRTRATTKEDVS